MDSSDTYLCFPHAFMPRISRRSCAGPGRRHFWADAGTRDPRRGDTANRLPASGA